MSAPVPTGFDGDEPDPFGPTERDLAYEQMLQALRRARFIMQSPLIASWVNGAGALDLVNAAIAEGERCAS